MGTNQTDSLSALEDFARDYLRDKTHHSDVKTEDLAESFRAFSGLPPFPALGDLRGVCGRLGIEVGELPAAVRKLGGANTWSALTGHSIFLRSDVSVAYAESTLCHELREVIEQTFARVKPDYLGLETHDNRAMNPRSDHFAGCLLMQRDATKARLEALGYDVVVFANEAVRSLASVILRTQELYSASQLPGFVGGIWLFEAPWTLAPAQLAPTGLKLAHKAHLSGFSIHSPRKKGPSHLLREVFPKQGSTVADFMVTARAFTAHRPVITLVEGFDLFRQQDYLVAAEPMVSGGVVWRILMTAVRSDFVEQVETWTTRLGVPWEAGAYQSA